MGAAEIFWLYFLLRSRRCHEVTEVVVLCIFSFLRSQKISAPRFSLQSFLFFISSLRGNVALHVDEAIPLLISASNQKNKKGFPLQSLPRTAVFAHRCIFIILMLYSNILHKNQNLNRQIFLPN